MGTLTTAHLVSICITAIHGSLYYSSTLFSNFSRNVWLCALYYCVWNANGFATAEMLKSDSVYVCVLSDFVTGSSVACIAVLAQDTSTSFDA